MKAKSCWEMIRKFLENHTCWVKCASEFAHGGCSFQAAYAAYVIVTLPFMYSHVFTNIVNTNLL